MSAEALQVHPSEPRGPLLRDSTRRALELHATDHEAFARLVERRYGRRWAGGFNPLGGEADDTPVAEWCFGSEAEYLGDVGKLSIFRAVLPGCVSDRTQNTVRLVPTVKLFAVGRRGHYPWAVRVA
jgi:hypothetical protein